MVNTFNFDFDMNNPELGKVIEAMKDYEEGPEAKKLVKILKTIPKDSFDFEKTSHALDFRFENDGFIQKNLGKVFFNLFKDDFRVGDGMYFMDCESDYLKKEGRKIVKNLSVKSCELDEVIDELTSADVELSLVLLGIVQRLFSTTMDYEDAKSIKELTRSSKEVKKRIRVFFKTLDRSTVNASDVVHDLDTDEWDDKECIVNFLISHFMDEMDLDGFETLYDSVNSNLRPKVLDGMRSIRREFCNDVDDLLGRFAASDSMCSSVLLDLVIELHSNSLSRTQIMKLYDDAPFDRTDDVANFYSNLSAELIKDISSEELESDTSHSDPKIAVAAKKYSLIAV